MDTKPNPSPEVAPSRVDTVLAASTLLVCVAIVVYKAFITTRININWDEFWYLSFVHALARGELTLLLQGAFTHLFTWLPGISPNEADQIVAARLVMVALLGVTAWLIWLLGRRWLEGFAATVPPIVYLSLVPVTVHGGSFRADSMLAPLIMGALVLLARRPGVARQEILAGILLGLAGAVTIKVLLFAPLIALLVAALTTHDKTHGWSSTGVTILRRLCRIGLAAGLVAIATLTLHAWSLPDVPESPGATSTESVAEFAARTAAATILNSEFFARGHLVKVYADWQPLPWLLIALGLVTAVFKRRYDVAALVLALLPIAIYRNSFPYFYVVMMAPASVLAGVSIRSILVYLSKTMQGRWRSAFVIALWAGLMYQCVAHMGRLWQDNQAIQRQIIAGAHEIFPTPVNYIDRCGMIASYRKVNFFISTWGLQAYRTRGEPFMPEALRSAQPAFVVMNAPALMTGRPRVNGLLETDRDLLQRFYPRYWGPIRVAGVVTQLQPGQPQQIEFPFPARYRIESGAPILVDGTLRQPGDIIDVVRFVTIELSTSLASTEAGPMVVKIFLAAARARPPAQPDPQAIFTGL